MQRVWKVLKVVVFGWGAFSLMITLVGLILSLFPSTPKGSEQSGKPAVVDQLLIDKQEGIFKLEAKQHIVAGKAGDVTITLTRDGQSLIDSYRLPVEKYHLEGISFYDAVLAPIGEKAAHIILLSGFQGEEGEGYGNGHVWVIRYADSVQLREVISLSDMHFWTKDPDVVIIGNKYFSLPYQQLFRSESYVVPVMIRVGDQIAISPLLSTEGKTALITTLDQELGARKKSLSMDEDQKLYARIQDTAKMIRESLDEKVFADL